MNPREEAARLIEQQLANKTKASDPATNSPKRANHYGLYELRELLDFIYEGPPRSESEKIRFTNQMTQKQQCARG